MLLLPRSTMNESAASKVIVRLSVMCYKCSAVAEMGDPLWTSAENWGPNFRPMSIVPGQLSFLPSAGRKMSTGQSAVIYSSIWPQQTSSYCCSTTGWHFVTYGKQPCPQAVCFSYLQTFMVLVYVNVLQHYVHKSRFQTQVPGAAVHLSCVRMVEIQSNGFPHPQNI